MMRYVIGLLVCCFLVTDLKAEPLRAVADPWPPYVSPTMPDQGLATRIVREALRRQGFELELDFVPWARALRMVRGGEADLLVAAWWTKERAAYLQYSEPYAINDVRFIKRSGDPFEYAGLESLTGKRVGVIRNYGYNDAFYNADNYQRVENVDLLVNIRMLLAGRIDLAVEDKLVATTILTQSAPELLGEIAFSENSLIVKKLQLATSRNHPRHRQIIAAFNAGLASMRADGTLASMAQASVGAVLDP